MQTAMETLPVIVIGLLLPTSDAAQLTIQAKVMIVTESPTVHVQCQFERHSRVRLYKDRNGFTAYRVEPGDHVLLELEFDHKVAGTSIRLAHNLMLELNSVPPPHQILNTATDIVQALYKFGGPQLQFESRTAAGVLQISGLSAEGLCHGRLKMVFTEPTRDQTGAGRAALDWVF